MSAHRIPSDVSLSNWIIADPGTGNAINPSRTGILRLVIGTTLETNTLVDPTIAGLRLTIAVLSVGSGGSRVITADTAVDRNGKTVFALNNVDDVFVLEALPDAPGTLRWQMVYPPLEITGMAPTTATAAGVSVVIAGGVGGSTSGAGGLVSLTGGTGTAGNSAGGAASLVCGAGQGSAAGGAIAVTGGAGGATGAGGAVTVAGGAGGATSGDGGAATVKGGVPIAGAGGAVNITASAGVGTNKDGSNVVLTAGAATGTGAPGVVQAASPFVEKMTQTALTDTATVTIAQLITKVLDGTPTAAATYTLPTAALLVAGIKAAKVGDSFWFVVNNKSAGANTITVAGGTGGTTDGTLTVAQNIIRSFLIIVTNVTAASEAYFCYGIG